MEGSVRLPAFHRPFAVGIQCVINNPLGRMLGHQGKECSFEAILKKYNLAEDAALALLGKIVNAHLGNIEWYRPEPLRLAHHLLRRHKMKLPFWVHKLSDQPRARHSIHFHMFARDPFHLPYHRLAG
jgi:hypothetical protein